MNVVYFRWGRAAKKPRAGTGLCGTCVPTAATAVSTGAFTSEEDAQNAFALAMQLVLIPVFGRTAWTAAWVGFRCTNQQCRARKPCGRRPTYFEIGAATVVVGGAVRWRLYVYLERKIQCVPPAPGTPAIEDVEPETLDPEHEWELPPEEPEPEEPDAPPVPPKPGEEKAVAQRRRRSPRLLAQAVTSRRRGAAKRASRRGRR